MKNLFYCIYDGVIRQGRFNDLYVDGGWHKDFKNGIVWNGRGCSGSCYYQLAGLSGTFCTSMMSSPRRVYATLEDCRNGVNGYSFQDYAVEVVKSIMSDGIKIECNNTHFVPEVSTTTNERGDDVYVIVLPYWTWNGARAEERHFREIRYHILMKSLDFKPHSGKIELMESMARFETLYPTKEDCMEDNVVEVVLFSDEGC